MLHNCKIVCKLATVARAAPQSLNQSAMRVLVLFSLLIIGPIAMGQTSKKDEAAAKCKQAVQLMDNGDIDASIKLLEEAQKLDPKNSLYPYEMAYALYLKKDYEGAIKKVKPLTKRKDAQDYMFQMLGNSYSSNAQREEAIKAYEQGIERFPNSGRLHLERGNMEMLIEDYDKAMFFYEKGIEVEPTFPSNYYWAGKIYCYSTEEVLGMIYGELFMNLERNSARTEEMSKLLHDTYMSEIQLRGDSVATVSFSKNATIYVTDPSDMSQFKMPFGVGVYEPNLLFSIFSVDSININTLNTIRSTFVDNYYRNKHNELYPIVLFDYQKKVKDAGHMEAYNYWILSKGDQARFEEWYDQNLDKWDAFIAWFRVNAIEINSENKFLSSNL